MKTLPSQTFCVLCDKNNCRNEEHSKEIITWKIDKAITIKGKERVREVTKIRVTTVLKVYANPKARSAMRTMLLI